MSDNLDPTKSEPIVVDNYAAYVDGEGGIAFPAVFTGAHYKAYYKAMQKADGDVALTIYNAEPHWRAACAWCEIDITTASGATITNETSYEDTPFHVSNFAREALDEYLAPFLIGDDWRVRLSNMLRDRL